jgi:hypothetical protein
MTFRENYTNKVERVRKMLNDATTSNFNKDTKNFPHDSRVDETLVCPHMESIRKDNESHLTWLSHVFADGQEVFIRACCDCTLKDLAQTDEFVTHRVPVLVLNEEDSRLSILISGSDMKAVSEKGIRLMRAVRS